MLSGNLAGIRKYNRRSADSSGKNVTPSEAAPQVRDTLAPTFCVRQILTHFPADVNLAARAADPGFAGPGGCSANRPTVIDDVHRLDQIVEHLRALWIIKIHSVDQNLCSLQARDAKQKL